jgi:hypothetical protein
VIAAGASAAPAAAAGELVLDRARHVSLRADPYAPADITPARHPLALASVAQAAAPGAPLPSASPTFAAGLLALAKAGQIDGAAYGRDLSDYARARRSLTRLKGTRNTELAAVLENLQLIARSGQLSASGLPAVMLTLNRNRQWWTTGPLISEGQRVGFAGSRIVWEYYAGQGIEIQWLASFGKANGYFMSGNHDTDLGALLDELVGLAAQRAGGVAWEYEFRFDGGSPPWVSGLAQGTAIQALSRAAIRLGRPQYFTAARSGLGIFQTPPPDGVRVATPAGAHYLIYSFAPNERVLNGFVQALVGLNDFAALANDAVGRQLFADGDAEARIEVPHYDTGAWSLYDRSTESDLSYHRLVRDFLLNLCRRTQSGRVSPLSAPADAIYCATANRFSAYMHQPPALVFAPPANHLRAGRTGLVSFDLSKISTVSWSLTRSGRIVSSGSGLLAHGLRRVALRPSGAGRYTVAVTATDLAGNTAHAAEPVLVTAAAPLRAGR